MDNFKAALDVDIAARQVQQIGNTGPDMTQVSIEFPEDTALVGMGPVCR
jgi:hypothetical protein